MAAKEFGKKVSKLIEEKTTGSDLVKALEQMYVDESITKGENELRFWLGQYPKGKWDTTADFNMQWDIFKNYIEISGLREDKSLKYLTTVLPPKYQQAWVAKYGTINTLAEAKTAMMEIAGLTKNNFAAETLYRERVQKPNESVSDFYRDLQALFVQAGYDEKAGGRAVLASDLESKLNNRL